MRLAVLSFLQDLLDEGKAFFTGKVYLVAISACHVGLGETTIRAHPMVCCFMKGVCLCLVSKPLSPSWDFALVLDPLTGDHFDPLETVDHKTLSYKTALLLALTSAKHVSDLHSLSVHPSCTQFSPTTPGL